MKMEKQLSIAGIKLKMSAITYDIRQNMRGT